MKGTVYDKEGITVKAVPSIFGPCLILQDGQTNKNVEIMAVQYRAMLSRAVKKENDSGSFPHGGFSIDGESVTIYHDEDRKRHEVTLAITKLKEIAEAVGI